MCPLFFVSVFKGLRPAKPHESRAAQWPIPSAKSFVFRSAVIATMLLSTLLHPVSLLFATPEGRLIRVAAKGLKTIMGTDQRTAVRVRRKNKKSELERNERGGMRCDSFRQGRNLRSRSVKTNTKENSII